MDLKKLGQQAKSLVDKRGGSESVKEDASELQEIAKGPGSLGDKAKAAVAAIKDPGEDGAGHRDRARRRSPPAAEAPVAQATDAGARARGRRRSRARSAASTRAARVTVAMAVSRRQPGARGGDPAA